MNLRHFEQTFRTFGAGAALHEVGKLAISKAVPFRLLRAMRLAPATLDRAFLAAPPELACRFLAPEELERFASDASNDLPIDFVRRALAKDDRCYGIVREGELVSYGWYSRKPTDAGDGLTFSFMPSYAYMYKGFTKPAFRGRRLHAIGMARAMMACVDEGAEGLVSYVDSANFASLKSCYRMGYEDIGALVAIKVGDLWMTLSTARAKELGVQLVADRPGSRHRVAIADAT